MRLARLLSVACTSLLAVPAAAQIAQPGRPASARHLALAPADVPAYVLPEPDLARLMREDEERNHWPLRYGAALATALASDDAGRWDALGGELVWRIRIASPGARSLGLLFDRYELPPTGRVFVYPGDRSTVLGAFTQATRQPNGMLAVQPVLGDELVVEYVQDAADPGRPELRIGEVVHDYRGILDQLAVDGSLALSGGGCLVDVNCPAGAAFQDIKRSVMFMLFSGTFCSAGLLNNTADDETPYFLTANHCGNMTNVVAVFGYENVGCGPGGASQADTVSGATLLAASSNHDSQLYVLSSSPPHVYEPFYAGWDRGSAPPGPAISISHPSGHPQKIARDHEAPVLSGTNFRATWDFGRLEGGSSGSPLFSGDKRVIGPACCVSDFTCNQWAIYGRFGLFWTARNLQTWLDPLGADPEGIDGFDPINGQAVVYNGSGANASVYRSVTPPTLGTTWIAEIDASIIPFPTTSWIVAYLTPSSGTFLPQGELLVSIAGGRLFLSVAAPSGGIAQHSNPIPNLPILIGQKAFTQGVLVAGAPLLLTNGLELRLR
jgi:lysyl endopeptidase